MSFKHLPLSESPIMRSLERIAIDKGIIKHDVLEHIEAQPSTINLEASESFDDNLIRLCVGLRQKGFDKYADALEHKFMLYKEAKTHMYRAVDEDGEDVINFAHPEGDVNMGEAADNHGDVETILSRHKKIVDVVQKEPTGKLASYLAQCKIALGQAAATGEPQNPLALFERFTKNFSAEVKQVVTDAIGPVTKYYELPLANGKKVKDYFSSTLESAVGRPGINTIPEQFNHFVDMWKKDPEDAKDVIGLADRSVKSVFELLSAIDKTIDAGMPGFDNAKYTDSAYTRLNPYQESFQTIFNLVHGTDSGWHAQWFATGELDNAIAELRSAFQPINARINRYIINNTDQELTKDAQLVNWFKVESAYIEKFVGLLVKLNDAISSHQEEFAKPAKSSMGLINIDMLKSMAGKLTDTIPGGTVSLTEDLDFSSKDKFFKSIKAYPVSIMKDCLDAIKNSSLDQSFKNQILQRFQA